LKETVSYLSLHSIARSRKVFIDDEVLSITISSDEVLLKRVLINMLKNALEATLAGAEIVLNCSDDEGFVIFTVHNHGFMPPAVQAQVFQRSFSTKGIGRGLGTYSIKLLTERYLKGTVGFTTSAEKGTTFFVRIPKE